MNARAVFFLVALAPLGCSSGSSSTASPDGGSNDDATSSSNDTGSPFPDTGPRNVTPCPSAGGANVGTWQDITPDAFRSRSGLEVTSVAAAAHDPGTVYATAGDKTNGGTGSVGVWKSTDCGATWAKVSTGAHGADLDTGDLWQLLVDPTDSNVVYSTNGYGNDPTLYKSTNGGVDWTPLSTDTDHVLQSNFIQAVAMDPKDPKHLVVTPHENCAAPHAPMCFSETHDGGATWVQTTGPDDGWHEAAGLAIFGPSSWMYSNVNGAWLTTDAGKTFDKVLTAYAGDSHGPFYGGAYVASDGTAFLGCASTGVYVSKSTPLGKDWTLIPSSPQASSFVDDGVTLFASYQFDTSGAPFYSAALSDPTKWTNGNDASPVAKGAGTLSADPDHHVVYAAAWGAGLWRLVIR